MRTNRFNHQRYGRPEIGNAETYAFGRERYEDLLREADEYALEQRAAPAELTAGARCESLLAHLLNWTGLFRTSQPGRL